MRASLVLAALLATCAATGASSSLDDSSVLFQTLSRIVDDEVSMEEESDGPKMTVLVHTPLHAFEAAFHKETLLQVLMHSICHKLNLSYNNAKFRYNGKALDPKASLEQFGLTERCVIEVGGSQLEMQKEQLDYEKERKALEKRRQDELDRELAMAQEERAKAEQKEQAKEARKQAEEGRDRELAKEGRVHIRFVREVEGVRGKEVKIAVKRNNWLRGTMDLVVQRMGTDPEVTRFVLANKTAVKFDDTVQSLGLQEGDEIMVRTPHQSKAEQ